MTEQLPPPPSRAVRASHTRSSEQVVRNFAWTEQPPPIAAGVPDIEPPPPALQPYLPRFSVRYAIYSAIDGKKPSFGAWLIVGGVLDYAEFQAMVALHAWAVRNGWTPDWRHGR